MAFCTLNFHSPALSKASSMNVLFPEKGVGKPPFPVFYLLHGLADDHTIWARRTSIERHVAGLPLIVHRPSLHGPGLVNVSLHVSPHVDDTVAGAERCAGREWHPAAGGRQEVQRAYCPEA